MENAFFSNTQAEQQKSETVKKQRLVELVIDCVQTLNAQPVYLRLRIATCLEQPLQISGF